MKKVKGSSIIAMKATLNEITIYISFVKAFLAIEKFKFPLFKSPFSNENI